MKRHNRLFISALVAIGSLLSSISLAYEAGFKSLAVAPEHRSKVVNYHLWYPAYKDGKNEVIGENGIFYGQTAGLDATHAAGRFPLLLISHGGGGNAGQYGWLVKPLVKAGMVVAIPNHPGSTTGDSSPAGVIKLWNRPQDISAIIDQLQQHNNLKNHIDFSRISALGFSAGGYAVLTLAGGSVDQQTLKRYCDQPDDDMTVNFCTFLKRGNIDLHKINLAPVELSYTDRRINKIVAVDPGLANAFDKRSLERVKIPSLLINLGESKAIPPVVFAEPIHDALQNSEYTTLPDANHFTFLPNCKPNAKEILAKEGEPDPLCDLPKRAKRSRPRVHQELINLIKDYLIEKQSLD
ncbi:MAG: hypothetical protein CSB48_13190 [Proteobacteria bacterium]|nr:MAG: hypothetical protein CSB48_13190 [Pseudomonadota bacterium]